MACWLMGSTMPLVPSTEAALHPDVRVEGALGHLGTALDGNGHRKAAGVRRHSASRCSASAIIWRGTWLMAASPTGWSRPGFVTRPTPSPPKMRTSARSGFRTTSPQPAGRWSHPHRRRRPFQWRIAPCSVGGRTGGHLHHNALGVRRATVSGVAAGQQQTGRPVPPAPHRCRWYSRSAAASARCGRNARTAAFRRALPFRLRLRTAAYRAVYCVRSGRRGCGCSPVKRLFRGQHAGNTAGRNAHHCVRYFSANSSSCRLRITAS